MKNLSNESKRLTRLAGKDFVPISAKLYLVCAAVMDGIPDYDNPTRNFNIANNSRSMLALLVSSFLTGSTATSPTTTMEQGPADLFSGIRSWLLQLLSHLAVVLFTLAVWWCSARRQEAKQDEEEDEEQDMRKKSKASRRKKRKRKSQAAHKKDQESLQKTRRKRRGVKGKKKEAKRSF